MTRALGPLWISVWDEHGLMIEGFDNAPKVMMGHNSPLYRGWIEGRGYQPVKQLLNYDVAIGEGRSEERRDGKGSVSTCQSWWSADPQKKMNTQARIRNKH